MLQSFLTVGQQIITLYLLLVVGFVLGKVKILDDRASTAMSNLVMYVVSPCMMIVAFQRPLEREMLRNFGLVTGVSLLLHVVFIVVAVLLIRDGDTQRQGDLRFAAVFSNCGFIGYPLMAAMLGSIGIFYGSAYVIVFTVLTWTWGVYAVTDDRSQLRLNTLYFKFCSWHTVTYKLLFLNIYIFVAHYLLFCRGTIMVQIYNKNSNNKQSQWEMI